MGRDGAPWLYDADSGLPIDARNAAHSNGRVQIMATGLGKVRPDWPTDLAAPLEDPPVVAATMRAFLDGSPVPVSRAMLAHPPAASHNRPYSTSSDQPSSTCFTLLMNWSARAPSIRRWSKLSERRQMERMAMASSITTGVFSTVPTPMMATWG